MSICIFILFLDNTHILLQKALKMVSVTFTGRSADFLFLTYPTSEYLSKFSNTLYSSSHHLKEQPIEINIALTFIFNKSIYQIIVNLYNGHIFYEIFYKILSKIYILFF